MKRIVMILVFLFTSAFGFSQGSCEFCNGFDATLTASPGPTGYTYAWSTLETTQVITVTAGTYTVTVTETASGCTGESTITVTECPLVTFTVSGTDNTGCNVPNGEVTTTTPVGGCDGAPYTWNWEESAVGIGNTQTITGLDGGTYDVTVTDNTGCTSTGQVVITDNAPAFDADIDCVPSN